MNLIERNEYERNLLLKNNDGFRFMENRLGVIGNQGFTPSSVQGVNDLSQILMYQGGFAQEERMIRDKRRTLDRAVRYSYQGAFIKKHYPTDVELMDGVQDLPPVRALINPNKVKQDYDDKILSVGFEYGFVPGDVFQWLGTKTYWLIYLQDLTELAYFRGQIRKCSYEIQWMDKDRKLKKTFAALSGPTETRIDYLQKYGNSYDNPNYSLSIMIPKNEDNLKYFVRYAKFYLSDGVHQVCWRIEAVDAFSMEGIIQFTAVEYYGNKDEDDIEQGIVGAKLNAINTEINTDPTAVLIDGEAFIKPKSEHIYIFKGSQNGTWSIDNKYPVKFDTYINDNGLHAIKLKWNNSYSGQFDLLFKSYQNQPLAVKTIVVESLF